MADQTPVNAIVVPRNTMTSGQTPMFLALFNADGSPRVLPATPVAAQANSTATTVADLVVDFNALLAKLRTAKVLAP